LISVSFVGRINLPPAGDFETHGGYKRFEFSRQKARGNPTGRFFLKAEFLPAGVGTVSASGWALHDRNYWAGAVDEFALTGARGSRNGVPHSPARVLKVHKPSMLTANNPSNACIDKQKPGRSGGPRLARLKSRRFEEEIPPNRQIWGLNYLRLRATKPRTESSDGAGRGKDGTQIRRGPRCLYQTDPLESAPGRIPAFNIACRWLPWSAV